MTTGTAGAVGGNGHVSTSARTKVTIRELRFAYGATRVLKGISMNIPEHQATAIIGPSGCGKSTLIKSINRISEVVHRVHVEGEVALDGKSVYAPDIDLVDLRRRVGMVFQKPNPFPKSIFENVAFGLRIHGLVAPKDLAEVVERSLRQAALWDEVKDRLQTSAMELSGGQQQRLCIARALAVDPEVILMDEPCSALDPLATAKIEELIYALKEAYTIVIVTHNMQQAARVSDWTSFLYNGEQIEFGPTEKLFTKPDQPMTEQYITGRFG